MRSYLHGIRPNNRRSATTHQNAAPARHYHESPAAPPSFDFEMPQSEQSPYSNVNEPSPVSLFPPILPPIPRIASYNDSQVLEGGQASGQERLTSSPELRRPTRQDGNYIPTIQPPRNMMPLPMIPVQSRDEYLGNPPGQTEMPPPPLPPERPRPSQQRKKRPIDVRFESMRSYSESPFRSSAYGPLETLEAPPEPLRRPPPPPPKTRHQQISVPVAVQSPHFPHQNDSFSYFSRIQNPSSSHGRHQSESQDLYRSSPPPPNLPSHTAAIQHRHGKTKLNLLNPMALLARRRSHQAAEEAYSQNQNGLGLRLPDDYDPRIRGNVVHDFSAPRPGRNGDVHNSAGRSQAWDPDYRQLLLSKKPNNTPRQDDDSTSSPEREHTPVFKENFDDGFVDGQAGPAKRLSSAFLYQMSVQESQPQPDPSSLPAFARNLPANLSTNIEDIQKPCPPLPNASLDVVLESPDIDQQHSHSSPPTSPPRARTSAASITDITLQGTGSPKRYKSNASRFSFDQAGVGSTAQEKLLEEKHRQKAKQKEKQKQRESTTSFEDHVDEDDYYGYDDMDDGLEERIPGVNVDDDLILGEQRPPVSHQATDAFRFSSPHKSSFESNISPVSTGLTSPATPRDLQGQVIGYAVSKPAMKVEQAPNEAVKERGYENQATPSLSRPNLDADPIHRGVPSQTEFTGTPKRFEPEDDDLYFDDGIIEDVDANSCEEFDESVFDDNDNGIYGLPLRDRNLRPTDPESQACDEAVRPQAPNIDASYSTAREEQPGVPSSHQSLSSDSFTAELRDALTDLNQPRRSMFNSTAGLTQDNLAAYNQKSLPLTVCHAGNGEGLAHQQEPHILVEPTIDPGSSGMIRSGNLHSQDLAGLPVFEDYDDDAEDDPIVAAANAEALENDDDGFYGQEFGFFARAPGSDEAEYANGGYFGSRALNGVHRSYSGRDNFQEPTLTPITERSEWSNRNSTVSLAMQGYPISAASLAGPQYAETAIDDIHMQLSMLKQLRRGAFGDGSGGSLRSSFSSQNSSGSPLLFAPANTNMLPSSALQQASNSNLNLLASAAGSNQNLSSSFHSLGSSNGLASSSNDSGSPSPGSPTITISTAPPPPLPGTQPGSTLPSQPIYSPPLPPPTSSSTIQQDTAPPHPPRTIPIPPVPKTTPSPSSWAPGHSRNSSGAESVSYMEEEGGKWVLEKRRVGEMGEVEILGRSVVGRI